MSQHLRGAAHAYHPAAELIFQAPESPPGRRPFVVTDLGRRIEPIPRSSSRVPLDDRHVPKHLDDGFDFIGIICGVHQFIEDRLHAVAWHWWQARMAVFTAVNSLLIVVLTSYIINRWRAREERIRQLSNHDDLTGLANRRHLGRMLLTEFERARRYGRHLSCAIVDLHHFRTVKDTHGHQVGDRLLEATARLVAQMTRRSDVIARYGGDEFMLVLPETPTEGAREFAERCRKTIEASSIECGGLIVRATASVGIGTIDHPDVHCVDDLIRITDKALYAAKEQGRNRVLIWS